MAWIKLHQTLPNNKKTLRLKRILKIKTPQAVGHLCMLWLWAIDNAQDGDLSAFSADEIAEVAGWEKNPATFTEALTEAGFLDDNAMLHDWDEYAGRLIDQREWQKKGTRERVRRFREKSKNSDDNSGSNSDVTRYTGVTEALQSVTCNAAECEQSVTVTHREKSRVDKSREEKSRVENTPPIAPHGGESEKRPEEKKGERRKSALTAKQKEGFTTFWEAYPRKVSIAAAEKAWSKLPTDDALYAEIVSGVKRAMTQDRRFEETQFTPHPASWLNAQGWKDEYIDWNKPHSKPLTENERGSIPGMARLAVEMLADEDDDDEP